MAGLLAKEGDSERRAEGVGPHLPGFAIEPRGHIDGDDRHARFPDQHHEIVAQGLGKAGAKQRIDDESGAVERAKRLDRPTPAFRHDEGIAFEPGALAIESEPHRPAPVFEKARHDEAIAAIVAGSAHNKGRARAEAA